VPRPGGRVTIRVYNVLGQLVQTIVDRNHAPGYYTQFWNGTNGSGNRVATGIYFVQMITPEFQSTKKILMLK